MAKPVHSKTYGSISLSTLSLWSGVVMFRCKLPVLSVENIINKLYQLKLLWCTQGGGGGAQVGGAFLFKPVNPALISLAVFIQLSKSKLRKANQLLCVFRFQVCRLYIKSSS